MLRAGYGDRCAETRSGVRELWAFDRGSGDEVTPRGRVRYMKRLASDAEAKAERARQPDPDERPAQGRDGAAGSGGGETQTASQATAGGQPAEWPEGNKRNSGAAKTRTWGEIAWAAQT
jgi:hypothetical protein